MTESGFLIASFKRQALMDLPYYSEPLHQEIVCKDNVHVWCVSLDVDAKRANSFMQILAEDERARAQRIRIENSRRYYVAARGFLRMIVSAYLKKRPEHLEFQYNQHGKPAILSGSDYTGISFNMSHSHGVALYGIALDRTLGVDIEKIRVDMPHVKIAKRFFSAQEYEALLTLPPEQQTHAFFSCWTRKEAYLKARGEGISSSLRSFSVSFLPGEAPALIDHPLGFQEISRWSVINIDVGPDYKAALVIEGQAASFSRKGTWPCPARLLPFSARSIFSH
jgi:4'-phosphopantetheinyl transferase